jgi:4a-hydroxytetrahydrobiopterin dehydratase
MTDGVAWRLRSLPGWRQEGEAIVKEFKFADFKAAFTFMTKAAIEAESLNHHPEWTNVYNRVNVRLSTHDQGKVTPLDFKLAAAMERIAKEVG